jgi:hypothetical protein
MTLPNYRSDRDQRRARQRVEANARLTAGAAVVLLVLLAIEGVTVVRVGQLLTLHVVVGMLLVPPVILKIASTSWRFTRYYLRDPAYREKGPPMMVLRVLGPFVVALTVVLFASGIAPLLDPNGLGGHLLLIHRASFIVWLAVMAVHVLGHVVETARLALRDWTRRARRRVPGASLRQLVIVASLAVGAILAVSLVGKVGDFRQTHEGHHKGFISPTGQAIPSSEYTVTGRPHFRLPAA